jgi:hypothetical protein
LGADTEKCTRIAIELLLEGKENVRGRNKQKGLRLKEVQVAALIEFE